MARNMLVSKKQIRLRGNIYRRKHHNIYTPYIKICAFVFRCGIFGELLLSVEESVAFLLLRSLYFEQIVYIAVVILTERLDQCLLFCPDTNWYQLQFGLRGWKNSWNEYTICISKIINDIRKTFNIDKLVLLGYPKWHGFTISKPINLCINLRQLKTRVIEIIPIHLYQEIWLKCI